MDSISKATSSQKAKKRKEVAVCIGKASISWIYALSLA